VKPNLEKMKLLSRDLRDGKEYPRSPRGTLGGYVLAARAVDGATDDEIAEWIGQHAEIHSRAEIIAWNNKERDLRLSDLPPETQEYMEDYIAKFVPRNRVVYHWFNAYDLEEERL